MFAPWIGKNFREAGNVLNGRRVLIVGETQEPDDGDMAGATHRMILRHLAGERSRTLTMLAEAVVGRSLREMGEGEEQAVWDSIAYYTYVTEPVLPEVRATARQLSAGRAPLRQVLREIGPEVALVLGLESWLDAAQGLGMNGDPLKAEYHQVEGVLLGRMQRPSRVFPHLVWNGFLRDALRHSVPAEIVPRSIWATAMTVG